VLPIAGPSQVWGSSGGRCLQALIVSWVEPLSEARAERAVVERATNLQQKIGPASRPAHLLRFIHPAVPGNWPFLQ
jgi:hypothetical protein